MNMKRINWNEFNQIRRALIAEKARIDLFLGKQDTAYKIQLQNRSDIISSVLKPQVYDESRLKDDLLSISIKVLDIDPYIVTALDWRCLDKTLDTYQEAIWTCHSDTAKKKDEIQFAVYQHYYHNTNGGIWAAPFEITTSILNQI